MSAIGAAAGESHRLTVLGNTFPSRDFTRLPFLSLGLAALLMVAASDVLAQTTAGPTAQNISLTPVTSAPEADLSSSDAKQRVELQRWIEDFTEWKRWWAEWANRPEPGMFTSSKPRRVKPRPPDWLSGECAGGIGDMEPLKRACELLAEWREDQVTMLSRQARQAVATKQEDGKKTIWWPQVHIDLLWPATQLRSNILGVVGVHTAISIKGRLQVFLAPGVMLLNLPAVDHSRVWKVATNYGIGFRLLDFTFPGDREASLNLNLAKSWLISDTRDVLVGKNLDFVGFSINFKRR